MTLPIVSFVLINHSAVIPDLIRNLTSRCHSLGKGNLYNKVNFIDSRLRGNDTSHKAKVVSLNKIPNKNAWPYLLLVVATLIASWSLLKPGYFPMHDDIQIMRLYEMTKCFADGQIPCRWVPDMGAGYGHPLFNYHPVFPYYLGMVFVYLGFSLIVTAKILFFLSFLLPTLFMYLLLKQFFPKSASLAGAVVFLFAPYHSVEVYVRGALTENWGIVFYPLILYSLYRLIQDNRRFYLFLSLLSLTGLFLSHNISTVLFLPFACVWSIFWLWRLGKFRLFPKVALAFIWAVALSAFFILPAFLERNLVRMDVLTTGYYDFRQHFVTLKQLFLSRFWGYGPSRPGPEDSMPFQVGLPLWPLIISGGVIVYRFIKTRRFNYLPSLLVLAFCGLTLFLTHARSVYIWELLPILSYVQFPWRFLSLVIFFGSFTAASFLATFSGKKMVLVSLAVIILSVGLNLSYFQPSRFDQSETDTSILSGDKWQTQSMTTLLDYYPSQVETIPTKLAPPYPWLVASGSATIANYHKRSSSWGFTITVNGKPATITVPIFDFPNWAVTLDGLPYQHVVSQPEGLVQVLIPIGQHTVSGRLTDTPLRSVSNTISFFALLGLLFYFVGPWLAHIYTSLTKRFNQAIIKRCVSNKS